VAALLAIGAAAACGDSGRDAASSAAESSATPGTLVSALGRADGAAAPSASSLTIQPGALREILEEVPAPLPPTSASGTRVGTDTGLPAASARPDEGEDDSILLNLRTKLEPSNAGTERDLRATLYFDLVDRCRDDGGARLPAESVLVSFRVDARGQIERGSVTTTPLDPKFAKAAECMLRVVRTSDAHFTPARLGQPIAVRAKVPSVD
jgi:hypothetical protein